jgi:hypothetical protein
VSTRVPQLPLINSDIAKNKLDYAALEPMSGEFNRSSMS